MVYMGSRIPVYIVASLDAWASDKLRSPVHPNHRAMVSSAMQWRGAGQSAGQGVGPRRGGTRTPNPRFWRQLAAIFWRFTQASSSPLRADFAGSYIFSCFPVSDGVILILLTGRLPSSKIIGKAMPRGRITKRAVDALQCPAGKDREFLWDDAVAGFGVAVFPSCTKDDPIIRDRSRAAHVRERDLNLVVTMLIGILDKSCGLCYRLNHGHNIPNERS